MGWLSSEMLTGANLPALVLEEYFRQPFLSLINNAKIATILSAFYDILKDTGMKGLRAIFTRAVIKMNFQTL